MWISANHIYICQTPPRSWLFVFFLFFFVVKKKIDALTSVSQRHRRWTALGFSFSEQISEYF
jgi:hypothetical protein